MSRKNFKCTLAYKGANYYGWQRQNNVVTIQGLVDYTLYRAFGREIRTVGASRTDAGVHAYGQVFNFLTDTDLKEDNVYHILNNLLPPDIRVTRVQEMRGAFNARWNVKRKLYRYLINNSAVQYPFYEGLCWHVPQRLDLARMRKALPLFKGVKNYTAFSRAGSDPKTYEREVDRIKVTSDGKWVALDFFGKSFLYHMVRKMVSVLVLYARGELKDEDINSMFELKERNMARNTAPAEGLYLVKIIYDSKLKSEDDGEME